MNLWLIHIVGSHWRKEIGSKISWTYIICIGIWIISPPDVVLCCENSIFSCFYVGPTIPVSVFIRCISGARALSIKSRIDWPPSSWNIILDREIILGRSTHFWYYSNPYSIEFSFFEYTILDTFRRYELSIGINSF